MNKWAQAILAVLAVPLLAQAQQPPTERIINVETPLQQAIDEQMRIHREGGRPEVLRTSNALIYPFGVYQPTLTCTVLRICIIELEPGELLQSMGTGDNVRWNIDHAITGPQGNTVYISVVPTDFDLTTNLVISTDRRMYHITLDSPPRKEGPDNLNPLEQYTRSVKFYYPEALRVVGQVPPADQDVGLKLEELNYRYSWRADKKFPWEPLAVFDDGMRVFIRVPPEAEGSGVLMLGTDRDSRVGNYIVRNGYYIVEQVFDQARIILPGPPGRRFFFQKRRQTQRVLRIIRDR